MARVQQRELPLPGGAMVGIGRLESLVAAARTVSIEAARAITGTAALCWWAESVSRSGAEPSDFSARACPAPVELVARVVQTDAAAFGADLAALPVEDAAAQLGRLYTRMLPPEHRRAHGVFYTPSPLVRRLLDNAERAGIDWSRGKVISPSCGAGAFLIEDARRMLVAMAHADPSIALASIGARLRGWDIDPFACWLSQLAVEAVVLPHVLASGRRLPPITECRNSLLADLGDHAGAYCVVNDNPAFGKVKDRPDIRDRYGRSLHGHPNMYGLFTDLALRLANPDGGVVAYLTPTSWLGGEYFRHLRRTLSVEARPASIDIIESRKDVFDDVLQEVSLSCFVRGRADDSAACSVVHVEPDGLRVEASGRFTLPNDPEAPWILPRSADDVPVIQAMSGLTTRLRDWGYRVSTGPLVWNRHKARLFGENEPGRVTVIWAESVTQDCRFDYRCDKSNHRPYFQPRCHADPNLVRQPCLLVQRTTAKEQHRRLIGGVMTQSLLNRLGGVVSVENHLNMIVATTRKPAVPLGKLQEFFATEAADRAFRCINASVAVSASELEAMPLPAADDLLVALATSDAELAVGRLYGIDTSNGATVPSAGRRDTRATAADISRRHPVAGAHHQADHRKGGFLRALRRRYRQ
ncbi:MAG TPA: hypothetical protein VFW75_15365, partial [Acetobacteraceae bacterium]|nr:hypothetical protein [Acetobacteraceae bacterium]